MNNFISIMYKVKVRPIVLFFLLIIVFAVASSTKPTQAQSSTLPPVDATYHGLQQFYGFRVDAEYDAWTYGDIAFYAPPGRVTQEMANQWLAWYARADELYRMVVPRTDEEFDLAFRSNDHNFGRKKIIAFVEDSCGAGCGNKGQAETTVNLDLAIADPYNYTYHWTLFYEMGRGGGAEPFDYRAHWPNQTYYLPHLMAGLVYYDFGGMEGLLQELDGSQGVPGNMWRDLDNWSADGYQYVDYFTDQEQTWFDPNGYFPITTSILQRIAVEQGLETLNQILDNIADRPASKSFDTATEAMCAFQSAINEATTAYADRLVNEWGMPSCDGLPIPPSHASYAGDIRNDGSGMCIDRLIGTTQMSQGPCNGSEEQRLVEVPVDGGFLLQFENSNECVEDGYGGGTVNLWTCNPNPWMTFNWDEGRLRSNYSNLCMTISDERVNSGARLRMEPCSNSIFQKFNTTTTSVSPLWSSCQAMSDALGTHHNVTWGSATAEDQAWWIANGCNTQPSSTAPTPTPTPVPPTPTAMPATLEYALQNEGSGKCVDIPTDRGTNVTQVNCSGGTDQIVQEVSANGGFMLQSLNSDQCLDVSGTNILMWTCHGGDNQIFNWDGAQLRSKANDQCISIAGGSLNVGANVQTESCDNRPAQRFNTGAPQPTPTPSPESGGSTIVYVSSSSGGTVGTVGFSDEDILAFNPETGIWSRYFDGSDVGLGNSGAHDVDAFHLLDDGSILLSVVDATTLPDVGAIDDSDIVRFVPTSLGANTAGTFELYFDGSDVGLTDASEDVDAIALLDNGDLLISTSGGVSTDVSGRDEDLLRFSPSSLGANTSGTWTLHYDGSDLGISNDTWGVWAKTASSDLYLSTKGSFSAPALSGSGADIIICAPGSLGSSTSCALRSFLIGSDSGIGGEVLDGISIVENATGTDAFGLGAAEVRLDTVGDAPDSSDAEDDESNADDEDGALSNTQQIFVPLITR